MSNSHRSYFIPIRFYIREFRDPLILTKSWFAFFFLIIENIKNQIGEDNSVSRRATGMIFEKYISYYIN